MGKIPNNRDLSNISVNILDATEHFFVEQKESFAGLWARDTLWATSSPFLGSAAASLEITGHIVGPKCVTAAFAISMTERTEALQRHRSQTRHTVFSCFEV